TGVAADIHKRYHGLLRQLEIVELNLVQSLPPERRHALVSLIRRAGRGTGQALAAAPAENPVAFSGSGAVYAEFPGHLGKSSYARCSRALQGRGVIAVAHGCGRSGQHVATLSDRLYPPRVAAAQLFAQARHVDGQLLPFTGKGLVPDRLDQPAARHDAL